MPDLAKRHREEEWMDAPGVDPQELERSLRFIRGVNRALGYTRATVGHLHRFSRAWDRSRQITVLDIATGSADIPRAIVRWAERRGFNVFVTGLDRHAQTALTARQQTRDHGRISIIQGDALCLPFESGSFDYVITNMFLHHLDDDVVVRVLREMDRVARRGIIAADLIRNRRAYFWISIFTWLANPMVRHDARVSVAQAFTRAEVESLRDRAGLAYASYHEHFAHRFVLSGEKLKG